MKVTYRDQIADLLKSGKSISGLEALGLFGCVDISTAMRDLRRQGMNIVTELKTDFRGKRYARYSLQRRNAKRGVR